MEQSLHIIITSQSETNNSLDTILTHCENIVGITINLALAIVGVIGICYLHKLKEKKLNATFGFFSMLKVRLHQILFIVEGDNAEYIFNRFVVDENRKDLPIECATSIEFDIDKLSNTASETLNFLKTTDNQIPASNEWILLMEKLIYFLEDCERLSNKKYYKWKEDYFDSLNEYKISNVNNLKQILDCISKEQNLLQDKLIKKHKENKKNKL